LYQNTLQRIDDSYKLSVYNDKLTAKGVVEATAKIKKAFPALTPEFYDVLLDMIKEEGFTDNRFIDAVNSVIKNCEYPSPTVAKFLSFDKSIKLYTYTDMIKMTGIDRKAFDKHRPVIIPGTKEKLWCHLADIERYNLEQYVPNKH